MPSRKETKAIIPVDRVEQRIYLIRGQRVILSHDLAVLYDVSAKALNQAVSRNEERFPGDFMFQLTASEFRILKSQFVTPNKAASDPFLRSQFVTLETDMRGRHLKYRPYAFTEQGVAMLSAVLRSATAVRVSIEIVRTFVRLRQLLATHEDLRVKLEALEQKFSEHDERFTLVFEAIRDLMDPPEDAPRKPIGFHTEHLPDTVLPPPKARRKSTKARN